MLYILTGEDDFTLNETLKEMKKGFRDETIAATNIATLEGETLSPNELRATTATMPFLADKRLVIVRGLLGKFQSRERTARRRPSTSQTKNEESNSHKAFAEIIKSLPETTNLVLVDSEPQKDNPLYSAIQSGAKILSYPSVRGRALENWIEKKVKEAGGNITSEAEKLLARLVGSNLWIMSSEIEKLILFVQGKPIQECDVMSLVSDARETTVFALIDAIFEGNAETAEGLLEKLLEAGEAPPYLLFMLARQLQFIVRLKDMRTQGKSRDEMRNKLGIADFAYQKTSEQADRYSFDRIKEIYKKVLETDIAVKTGKYEGELALNILVAELCKR